MSVAPPTPISLEQFLLQQQELRFEFDGFEPVAMTGGTSEHSAMCWPVPAITGSDISFLATRSWTCRKSASK
jgi:hypothetical protein